MGKLLFSIFILFLLSTRQIIAHEEGNLPFFTINGKISNTSSSQIMDVHPVHIATAQDITTETYLVNQPINFQIDILKLESKIPRNYLQALHYSWDFGDQEKGNGTDNTHIYTKAGSYILTITANIPATTTPSLIESVQLNIVPKKPYVLPTTKMKVQGTIVNDPLQDFIKVNFNYPVTFDATASYAGSAKIVEYMWDFGDGEKSQQPIITHLYKPGESYATPYLRVIDANGLVSDTFVTLANDPKIQPVKNNFPVFIGVGLLIFLTLTILCMIIFFRKLNKK